MTEQAQVGGGLRHTGGTSGRSVRRGITRELTMSAESSLAGTTYTMYRAREVRNTSPEAISHVSL